VSALATFGSAIPSAHQQILPACLPKRRLGLFQARVQGMVWRNSKICQVRIKRRNSSLKHPFQYSFRSLYALVQVECSSTISHTIGQALEHCCRRREFGTSIFPSMASHQIVQGSYFIQMPTQNGRHALVIFPPGSQSLEDIRHMYDLQEEDDFPPIQSLKRVITSVNGDCKCLLQS
jgi:hypothetical protein